MRTTLNAGLLTTALVIGLGAVAWAATNSSDTQELNDKDCITTGFTLHISTGLPCRQGSAS